MLSVAEIDVDGSRMESPNDFYRQFFAETAGLISPTTAAATWTP